MSFAHKIRVGVLRGGPSPEYEVSLNTGKTILANLPEEYEPLDVFISEDGAWHTAGLEKNPYNILRMVDVVVNAMHGAYGEDGKVQKFMENFGVPYTGSDSMASAVGINKIMSKNIFNNYGLKTPHHIIINENEDESDLVNKIDKGLPFPVIIKPISSGSSLGVSYIEKASQIKDALKKSFEHSPKLMVEEFINGKEVTCGVIEDFRGERLYTLLPVEIKPQLRPNFAILYAQGYDESKKATLGKQGYAGQAKQKTFFDYDSKYKNLESRYKIPSSFKEDEKLEIQKAASLIHEALGLRHYSRSDFIFNPRRGLLVLEVNTLPELSHHSSFVKSLEAVGGNIKEFLSHLITKALGRK